MDDAVGGPGPRAPGSSGDRQPDGAALLAGLVLIGCAVSLTLGVYARGHTPTGREITTLGFPTLLSMRRG